MLPSLLTTDNLGLAEAGVVPVPPPPRFRAPCGTIQNVEIIYASYERGYGNSAAKRAGLRYEEQVQQFLAGLFPNNYQASPEVHFRDDRGWRLCIPDGVMLCSDRTLVVEIKSQHMPEAWWQLKRLYEPVVAAWRPLPVQCLEVVKSFDPAMPFPCRVTLVEDLVSWISEPPTANFGVFQWKI